ncbi:MAG: 4Fe-4S ferredoxin [Rhodospirillales bacterium CG15_BIG_FIL_POST_REV_8_21_14_020_66_15]|nr:MAG: 4Fe-4S ferredoxin [Rhodospirillales bacterium CG15_BIG_FIL_POST_REV_8_21_14_020_66_15]
MKLNRKNVLVCDCEGTMTIDGRALAKACAQGGDADGDLRVATHLCRRQIEEFQRVAGAAGQAGETLLVACTQEAPLFLETGNEMDAPPALAFTNIREKAGWSADAPGKSKDKKASTNLTAKMAALLNEAAMDWAGARSVSMKSEGVTLVLGRGEDAIEAAKKLAGRLNVTLVLEGAQDVQPPAVMEFPVFKGKVTGAGGHLGAFKVAIAGFIAAKASSRGALEWEGEPQSGTSECDLILDLRGGPALFPHAEKRDGYFNPDPGNPARVADAIFQMADMVGEFEKPRYVDYDEKICAHARSRITGCTRCIDNCPAGAITPDNERVNIDPYLCGGCGVCASVCPTGAAGYALPLGDELFKRARAVLRTYLKAGGTDPVLLIHDTDQGEEAIGLIARMGRGLPANVIPFAVNEVTQVGIDLFLSAAAFGAVRCLILLPPRKRAEAQAQEGEIAIAEAVLDGLGYGTGRVAHLHLDDPSAVEDTLWSLEKLPAMPQGDFLPLGRKRAVMRLALDALHKAAPNKVDEIAMPAGAPFGTVTVDTAGCTLCLSCVGACPARALRDNPDKPQLSFVEDACVQCGLCVKTCPEKVITLTPRLSFKDEAKSPRVQKEEDPFHCIRCGKPYGTRATINQMTEKLKGHSMFAGDAINRLKMCDDCRIMVQFDVANPLAGTPRPATRTTDDYLREREQMRKTAEADMKAKGLAPEADNDG